MKIGRPSGIVSIAFVMLTLVSVVVLGAGCQTVRTKPDPLQQHTGADTGTNPPSAASLEEILAADAEIEPEPHSKVPIEVNSAVQKWIDYFTIVDRQRFRSFLERGLQYKELVKTILAEYGVPKELYYLAMIESGYVAHARSRASAVGAWQFMNATGRRYGLRVRRDLDERRDIVRSTHAAARHLKDLHERFHSWYLALAAYNAGEGRIRGAIRRGKSTDFWALASKRKLPRETMNYVPKFLAAVIIGRNPDKYGFLQLKADQFPPFEKATVPSMVRLDEISKRTSVPLSDLKRLNTHLIRGITPNGFRSYEIWVPDGKAPLIEGQSEYYARDTKTTYRQLAKTQRRIHRVRRGDTLITIAQKYRLPVRELKKLNGLRSDRIFRGRILKVTAAGT